MTQQNLLEDEEISEPGEFRPSPEDIQELIEALTEYDRPAHMSSVNY